MKGSFQRAYPTIRSSQCSLVQAESIIATNEAYKKMKAT